jgi:hypothetical protein
MPIQQIFVTRFFQLALNRDFAEAERVLDNIKKQMPNSEWSKGYVMALEGMLIAYKSKNDKYAFINKVELDEKNVIRLQEEFTSRAKNLIGSEFDRGYFSAWAELMKFVSKSKLWGINKQKLKLEEQEDVEVGGEIVERLEE